jgi:uncharacterized protein YbaR (Trm112 family)
VFAPLLLCPHIDATLDPKGGKVKKELMEILVCPVCKSELKLEVTIEEGDEVIQGSLICSRCNESYPIDDAIPNLLPPQMRA